ncbi:MAG: hypothetical protein U5N56_11710 [Candidatus Marinimicrobia bacterium]|nr:hypothetical protein [Candidatus Neomarinimicrobiota bacterium]
MIGSGILYVEYDTEIFGSSIAGTNSLECKRIDLLGEYIIPDVLAAYVLYEIK